MMTYNTLNVTNNKNNGSERLKKGLKTMQTKAEKAKATKKDKLRSRYCEHCDQMIVYDGTQGRKKFCNDACKMAHHRRLKEYRERWNPTPAPKPDPNRVAQQYVNVAWAHLAEIETAL
jgi:hypothetical protein